MRELAGRTAFVTGGASGIGLALGAAFAQAGMKVILADIETGALAAAVKSLHDFGPSIRGVACDVADPISVERAAKASYEAFGNVHVVCNNAGVAAAGGIDNISLDNWRWVLDVNLMGVLHGIRTFLPHIRAHGEGGHIVNTASMAGMNSGLGFSPYVASKFAVVGMSEGLATERRRRRIPQARRACCSPSLPNACSPGSTHRMSRRAFSPRSVRRNSTCSPIRKCAASWKTGSPPSWRRWTKWRLASLRGIRGNVKVRQLRRSLDRHSRRAGCLAATNSLARSEGGTHLQYGGECRFQRVASG